MTYNQAKTRIMHPEAYTYVQVTDAAMAILASARAPRNDLIAAQNILASACGYAHVAPALDTWHPRTWRA